MTLKEILEERRRASAQQYKEEFFGTEQVAVQAVETGVNYNPYEIFPEIWAWVRLFDGCEDF